MRNYYIGTAGGNAISILLTGTGSVAEGAQWYITNPSGKTVLSTSYDWPQYYTVNSVKYSLWNLIQNYQNDFVSPASTNTFTYFFRSWPNHLHGGSSVDDNNGCTTIGTGENSNMVYFSPSCGRTQCTQNFNAPSGYEGHNTPGISFTVQFGGGWGTTTVGVHKGDLLIATEATYTAGVVFGTPQDSLGNTWTADGSAP